MKESDIEALSIVQEVLHSMLPTLAASSTADLGDIGSALEFTAANGTINPMAGQMLTDLASGATGLHAAGIRKQ
jgi:hypothetical protein